MPQYQYRVITAPNRGIKAKGIKTPEDRFSHALEQVMNEMAAEGWEYQRAETLPSLERSGLTSTTTNWRNVLVFRKALETPVPVPAEVAKPASEDRREPPVVAPQTPDDDASRSAGASRVLSDNGVEAPGDDAGTTGSVRQPAESRKTDKTGD